jgi:hypothetical protein
VYVCKIADEGYGEGLRLVAWGSGVGEHTDGTMDDAISWYQIKRTEDETLEDILRDVMDESRIGGENNLFLEGGTRQKNTMMELSRIAINTILYLGCENRSVKTTTPEKRRQMAKNKKRSAKKANRRINILPSGATVTVVGPSLERQLDDVHPSGSYVRKHLRRGHWHHYWVGSRTDEDGNKTKGTRRVRKFVAPTIVGKDSTTEITKRKYRFSS